jgi:HK97 family phage portal protein
MGLIDRVLDGYFKRKGLKPQYNGQIIPVNSLSIGGYQSKDWIEAYQGNSDLYAVATFLIRKAASIPWFVYRKRTDKGSKAALERYKLLTKGIGFSGAFDQALVARKKALDENEIVEGTALSERLKRPNEFHGQDQFFESLFGYRVLSGEGNIWVNAGDINDTDGEPVEMQVLPTQFVEIYPDKDDLYGIAAYRLAVGGGINLPKENLLMWKNWRPEFSESTRIHMRGISPVQVAWKTYMMGDNAGAATANLLKNGGSRGALSPQATAGSPSPILTPEQASMAKKMVNDSLNGNVNAGNIGVLARAYDYLNFGLSAVDMDVVSVMDLTLHQWCRVLGLPTVLFDSEHTSDNNYQNAMRDLVTNTIVPMMASLRDELNRWLVPRFGDTGLFVDFDITSLPELQRDMEKMINGLKSAYWLTEDEKRMAMNYEERGGAYSTSLVPMGLTPIEMIGQEIAAPEDEPDVDY